MNETTFENVRVKDKVWVDNYKVWGKVYSICKENILYPITVQFRDPSCIHNNFLYENFTYTGYNKTSNLRRSLYWDEIPEPVAPPRPKRKIKKTIRRWILHSPEGVEFLYFNHQSADNATIGTQNICIEVTGEYEIEE